MQPGKVGVEAYLFDATLKRKAKVTTFRLEMYATDSTIVLAGRGYLGKGALKGVATQDSLKVYFPSTNEYVIDAFSEVLSSNDCMVGLTTFNPVQYMFAPPDSSRSDSALSIQVTQSYPKKTICLVKSPKCKWSMTLSYDNRDGRVRPFELNFDNGNGTTLIATRREYQPHASIVASRFAFTYPPDARPIER